MTRIDIAMYDFWPERYIWMDIGEILADHNPWWRDPADRRARRYPVRRDLQGQVLAQVGRPTDRRAVVVLGPRQVGKTTLLLQTADDLLERGWPAANLTYFDFSDDRITREVSPREVIEAKPVGLVADHPRAFFLDEIRLAPRWDRWLKQAVDTTAHRIVVTDSAASLLRDAARESGPGRWDEVRLEGLSFSEFARLHGQPREPLAAVLARAPNLLERYLDLGGFPEHARSDDPPEVRRRLRTDIVDRAILRDLIPFGVDVQRVKDLFVYLVQDSGAIFKPTERARDLAADRRSVGEWLRRLEETLLVVPLPRVTARATARLRSEPKLYAADHGLVTAFAPSPREAAVRARAFEAVVFRHLRQIAPGLARDLGYFRQGDDELDFVCELEGARVGVEVTSSSRLRPEKIEGMKAAGKRAGATRLLLVHGGYLEQPAREVQLVPLPRFLLDPRSALEGAAR